MESLPRALANRHRDHGMRFAVVEPASSAAIEEAQRRLGVELPAPVRGFYETCNGFVIEDPALVLLPLEQLEFTSPQHLHFATFAGQHQVCFETSQLDSAGEWLIVGAGDHRITLTIGSFLANKIFKWIDRRHPIWELPPYPRVRV